MKCHNCDYEWNYTGNEKYLCTCPRCHWKVNVNKQGNKDDK